MIYCSGDFHLKLIVFLPVSVCTAISSAVSTAGCSGVCAGGSEKPCGNRVYKWVRTGALEDSQQTPVSEDPSLWNRELMG